MKVGTIAMSSNFLAYTALTKPASAKIVAPRNTVLSVTHGCGMRTVVNSEAISRTIAPTATPPAHHRAGDVAGEDHPVRHRTDQQLLDMAAELGAEERGGDVAVAVLDHAHHHQPGDDELHVAEAVHLADARADQAAEDQEVQRHRDRRRHQGLAPDAQDAHELAAHDRAQRDQVALRRG